MFVVPAELSCFQIYDRSALRGPAGRDAETPSWWPRWDRWVWTDGWTSRTVHKFLQRDCCCCSASLCTFVVLYSDDFDPCFVGRSRTALFVSLCLSRSPRRSQSTRLAPTQCEAVSRTKGATSAGRDTPSHLLLYPDWGWAVAGPRVSAVSVPGSGLPPRLPQPNSHSLGISGGERQKAGLRWLRRPGGLT